MTDDEGAIRELIYTWMAASKAGDTVTVRELQVLGDWAYAGNYLQVSVTPPSDNTTQRDGYTLSILRKGSSGN